MVSEVESYARSFAREIRAQFEPQIDAAIQGLAKNHSADPDMVEALLWQELVDVLGEGSTDED